MYSIENNTQGQINIQFKKKYMTTQLANSLLQSNILNAPTFNIELTNLSFYGKTIYTLEDYLRRENNRGLSYIQTNRLIFCLSSLQKILETNNYGFYSFDPNDILIIDEWDFICISPNLIKNIVFNNTTDFIFKSPFQKNIFCSTEIKNISTLPSYIPFNSWYISIASLAYYCFFYKNLLFENLLLEKVEQKPHPRFEINFEIINTIKYTKLYWFFIKVFNSRRLIYI